MGSIDLAAFHTQLPQAPNPLADFARLIEFKNAAQEAQLRQGQMQLQQQAIKDQQALTQAWQNWDGKDPDALIKGVLQAGGSGDAANRMEQTMMARQQQKNALSESDFALQQKRNDRLLGRFDAAEQVPDAQLVGHVQQAINDSVTSGDLDPQHAQMGYQLLQQAGNNPQALRQGLDSFKKGYQLESVQYERAKSAAEAYKSQQQGQEAELNAKMLQSKIDFYKKYGLPANLTPEVPRVEQSRPC